MFDVVYGEKNFTVHILYMNFTVHILYISGISAKKKRAVISSISNLEALYLLKHLEPTIMALHG